MFFMKSKIIDEDMQNIFNRKINWNVFRNKTILITGATGMLATYVVYFLLYLNEFQGMNIHIILLVRDIAKVQRRFGKYSQKGFQNIYSFDINRPINIEEDIDYIIHAASLASPQYYRPMPVEVAAPNAVGTYYILQLAREKQVKKILYFSSGDVYGKLPENIGDIKEDMMGITDPLAEHSCYGESKRMGETWCAAFTREYGVPAVIARIGHTYGPTMDLANDPRVFASFMKCITEGKDIEMFSDGSAKRPFCYIADAVAAYFLLLLKGKDGEAYNVCNTRAFISILELANILVSFRRDLKLKVIRKVRLKGDKYIDNHNNLANRPIEDKLNLLGWECNYRVEEGFYRVWQYFSQK